MTAPQAAPPSHLTTASPPQSASAQQTTPVPDLSAKIPKLVPRKRTPGSSALSRRRGAPEAEDGSSPAPPTPALPSPPDLTGHDFVKPSRRILGPEDHERFLNSDTCKLVQAWIFGISDSVRDRSVSSVPDSDLTLTIRKILRILDEAEKVLERCPPEDTGSRFGNPVFKTFLDEVAKQLPEWHAQLGLTDVSLIEEVSTYLHNSFGNRSRIDYGSGHEVNFFLWLLCLNRLSLLPPATFPAIGLVVLPAYLALMRKIQAAYYLEPAGSHGVWGLDDYQFIPFLFGASQLVDHPYITPKSIHNTLTLEECSKDFLYLDQVAFVNSVKNVEGLRWHSPMLDDISSAKSWAKIEAGMRKMFVKEILHKLPVMQHFLFGSLIPAVEGMSTEEECGQADDDDALEGGEVKVFTDEAGKRHVHASTGWGDCCGIRVPAAIGAEGEERKAGGRALRRVPFD